MSLVRCVICRAVVKGRVPKGGDGSGEVPYWHKRWQSGRDPYVDGGGGRMAPCYGRFEIGERLPEGR